MKFHFRSCRLSFEKAPMILNRKIKWVCIFGKQWRPSRCLVQDPDIAKFVRSCDNNVQMGLSLFWDVTRMKFVLGCRRYGTAYRLIFRDQAVLLWWSVTSISGQPISLKRCLTLEDRTDRLPRNISNQPPTYVAKYPKRTRPQLQGRRCLKFRSCQMYICLLL